MSGTEPNGWEEVRAWRKAKRAELVALRVGVPDDERKAWNERLTEHLVSAFDMPEEAVVGFCWPYKAEFDARFAVRRWRDRGAIAALPEVVQPKSPLTFRKWWPGAPTRPGVYDIPVPDGTEVVAPDVAIVPMNGFDERGYRLGYGGGFFDRTLDACERRMVAIGVAYEVLRLATIYPQPHDVPMDFVVTEAAIYAGGGDPIAALDAASARERFQRLLRSRGLPREAFGARGYSSPACYASEFPEYFGEEPKKT
ncbi:MAG TPA: 5-formyltetrahydrofolate cyclo-ligase [Burkholderiales bacterium]|nr:5-formyltetrahydrofolate cyclo-ligase [Burkholderiales bacterium]